MNPPTPEDITELRRLLTEADRLAVDADANGYTEGALRPAVRAQRAAEIALRNAAPALLTAAEELAALRGDDSCKCGCAAFADDMTCLTCRRAAYPLACGHPGMFRVWRSPPSTFEPGVPEPALRATTECVLCSVTGERDTLRLDLEAKAAVVEGLRASLATVTRERDEARDHVDQYTAIHARMRTLLGGKEGETIAVENLARVVVGERDELRAALDNERGEGEPPSEGWISTGTGANAGWRRKDGAASLRRQWEIQFWRVDGRPDLLARQYEYHPTAREAMRQADTALAGGKS